MNALQQWRITTNVTQRQMSARIAEMVGSRVSRAQYGGYEQGRNVPPAAIAEAIEKITGGAISAKTILERGLKPKRVQAKGDTGKHLLDRPRKPTEATRLETSPAQPDLAKSSAVALFKSAVGALAAARDLAEFAGLPDLAKTARALVELAGEGQ